MATTDHSERHQGPTPAGGAYAVSTYRDASGNPCPKVSASSVEIVECDADGGAIRRTYADIRPISGR